ncbi:MAG: NADH-quinone oxidoreductase subunit H [Burkholderiales bacterium]|nr:NADH-quinone oxidoreductase subunit H [Burkholderiales bacterium]
MDLLSQFTATGESMLGPWWPIAWNLIKIVAIVLPLMGCVAYLTLWERKMIGWMHVRLGPNRVGPAGLLQPIADALKLLLKEIIVPFGPDKALANINAGLLFLMAITSLEVYGVIVAGWASNSKYAFLGAMRASAQMVSYEIAMGFVLVIVLMVSGSLNLSEIVGGQLKGMGANLGLNFLSWNWLPLLPMFGVYIISGIAETSRHPFDVVEGESEIVAGHMVEYSGMSFAMFFLAEYANMILISMLATLMFLGGWGAPLAILDFIPGWIWLGIKTFLVVSIFIWVRASFPRYRYDQIMRLGWKIFIPLTVVYLVIVAVWMQTSWNIWK